MYDFLLDDAYTRLDTNQGLLKVTDPRTSEEVVVHQRIWLIVNKKGQHLLFLLSDHYLNFQVAHSGVTAGYAIFADALEAVGSFVSNPRKESCVDKNIRIRTLHGSNARGAPAAAREEDVTTLHGS